MLLRYLKSLIYNSVAELRLKGIKGEKVRIVKVDVDKHKEIAAYYQIQSVPTLMIFKDGKQLWRQSGVMRANDLSTILAQYE